MSTDNPDRTGEITRPRIRRTDPSVQLWRTVKHRVLTAKVGRTVWVSGDGYWLAHQSVVGEPPGKHQPAQQMAPKTVRSCLERYAANASTPFGKLAHEQITNPDLVIVGQASYKSARSVDKMSPVRVAFNGERFEALRRCVVRAAGEAEFEMRVDPWKQSVSWWHPRGYPVAVLLGVYTPDDRGWWL